MSNKFFGISDQTFKRFILAALALTTFLALVWMSYNYFVTDPFDPSLTGTASYGHNSEGVFWRFALITLIEAAILGFGLTAFSLGRFYWLRVLVLQILFGGWMLLMLLSGMHGGGVDGIHTIYLFGVNLLLFVLLVVSIVVEIAEFSRNRVKSND